MTQEDKLRNVKKELREAATKALTMRALTEPIPDDAKQWRNDVASRLDSLIGPSAEFNFRRCTEGAGGIDLDQTDGVRAFLYLHANHLNELASSLVATDLPDGQTSKRRDKTMADERKSHNTQVTVAVVALLGVLGTALIANWDKIFSPPEGPEQTDQVQDTLPTLEPPPDSSPERAGPATVEAAPTARDAEKLASRWIAALQSGEVDTLVALAEPPFYMDNQIEVSKSGIRTRYREMLNPGTAEFVVTRMDARTVGEFKAAGLIDDRDRLISSMRIEDDDFAVVVWVRDEAIVLFFRRVGADLEMAGFWD